MHINIRIIKIVSGFALLMLASCGALDVIGWGEPRTTRTPTAPQPELSVFAKDAQQCGCSGSKGVFATNVGGKTFSGKVAMLAQQTSSNKVCNYEVPVSLIGTQETFLGCTRQSEAPSSICGFVSPSPACGVSVVPQRRATSEWPIPFSCEAACAPGSETSEYCVRINHSVSRPEYKGRVEQIYQLFQANQNRILKPDFMALFDSPDDGECARGDIFFDSFTTGEYSFENGGNACQLTYQSPILDELRVELPSSVSARIKSGNKPTSFEMRFLGEYSAPAISFANPDFNADYGGVVRRVIWDTSQVLIETSSFCLAARL